MLSSAAHSLATKPWPRVVLQFPHPSGQPAARSASRPAADWESLIEAVCSRLYSQAEQRPLSSQAETALQLRHQMLECARALEQLQENLSSEFADRQAQMRRALHAAQMELEQARAELAGSQAEEQRARHLALHDALTGLPNRRYFRERLNQALNPGEGSPPGGMAVLFIDLDDFKKINDNHGHDVGDELLRVVGSRLSRVVRQEDMISRIGGDEFACLRMDWRSRGQLIQWAKKLYEVVAAPLTLGSVRLSIKPSIGISLYPADGATVPDLLKASDLAMYHAKQHRSGHAFYDQSRASADQA